MRSCLVLFLLVACATARAATISAASASLTAVQAAVDSASNGDTITIPNGSATWNAPLNIGSKRLIIRALNYTATARPGTSTVRNVVITYTGTTGHAITMTTGNDFHVGVGGIKFLPPVPGGQGGSATGIWGYVKFQGSGNKPPLMFDCHIVGNDRENVSSGEASFLSIDSLGGVVWNTLFDGTQVPDGTSVAGIGMGGAGIHLFGARTWATASTMGTLDTNGLVNVYFEDCNWQTWGQTDADNSARIVCRYSIMNGTSWQTHGFSSGTGGRHCELYNNTLVNTVNERNFSRYFWLRAGTALFTGNSVSNNNTGFGTPILFQAGDDEAPSGSYPINTAIGQGHNGTSYVGDPVYIWNNTGGSAQAWSVTSNWASQFQLNRDIFVSGVPGTAKPSTAGSPGAWAPFTYPHPLRTVIETTTDTSPPTPNPMTFASVPAAIDSASITMTATTATDAASVPVEYFFEETSGHTGGTNSGWQSSSTYVDTGLSPSTLYTYRVKARDAVLNETSYSSAASATTAAPTITGKVQATTIHATSVTTH